MQRAISHTYMTQTKMPDGVNLESIFHPSDFSEASEVAFVHALKTALAAGAKLTMLHVEASAGAEWQDFPGVRDTLERWGLIPKGSSKSAVGQLGIKVAKVLRMSKDPVKTCLGFLAENPTDLIVLAVSQREGRMRWLGKSVGEPIARRAGEMTLFIPHGVEGFVSRQDGAISLRNMLIPVTIKPRPQPSVKSAVRLIRNLPLPSGMVTLIHVGTTAEMPSLKPPTGPGAGWARSANRQTSSFEPPSNFAQI